MTVVVGDLIILCCRLNPLNQVYVLNLEKRAEKILKEQKVLIP